MDKINLSNKLKISVLTRNIQLGSLKYLPQPLKIDLNKTLEKALIFYRQNFLKDTLKVLNDKEILILKSSKDPNFSKGELLIIIIPQNEIRYVFQALVKEVTQEGYILKILNPRYDKRLILKNPISVLASYISHNLFLNFLQKNYFLIRNSNFSLENASELKDLQFYDLIFNENNQIDNEFKKVINTSQIQGKIVNISSGGLCIKISTALNIPENTHLIYTKFEISIKNKSIKFGLLCHLKNHHLEGQNTFMHLSFLIPFKPEVWHKIEEILKPLVK